LKLVTDCITPIFNDIGTITDAVEESLELVWHRFILIN